MDLDTSGSPIKNGNQNILKVNGYDIHPEDFITELFPEFESLNAAPENSENSVNTLLGSEDISNSQRFESPIKSHGNMNGHADEESQKNEKLHLLELKKKLIDKESLIADYENKLSKSMKDHKETNTCLDNVKRNCETLEKENLSLKEELNHFKARIHQLEELKLKKNEEDKEIANLQKDLSVKEKAQRKLKNELRSYTKKLEETNSYLEKVKSSNKRLWTLIAELGKTLSKAGLLTPKLKKILTKERAENFYASDIESEGESSKDVSLFINEIDMMPENKTCRNSTTKMVINSSDVHSTANPPLSSQDFPENNNSTNPTKITPEDINLNTLKSKNVSSSVFNLKSNIASKQLDTQSTTSTQKSSNIINPSAKVKSFGSNYFLKTCKNVLDDPDVMDWQVDNTFKELQDLRQQLPVYKEHFAPISPLPRTPSPNNFKMQPNNKKLLKPPGKRLNFCHQQSESFDVPEIQPPEISNSLTRNHINNVYELQSSPSSNQYSISTRRNNDGALKLTFNANVNSHLSLDLNTLQVSCVVAPHSLSSINFTDSNQIGILSPTPSHLVQTKEIHPQEKFHCPTLQSRSNTRTTNEVLANRRLSDTISNVNNNHSIPSQISVCELESSSTLNDVETEMKCKKVKLDSDENNIIIQANNELPASIKKNIPTKNHSFLPDNNIKGISNKEKIKFHGLNYDSMNENSHFNNIPSAFSQPSVLPELQNVPLNFDPPVIPVPILNASISSDTKKIKRSKSIGKVNSQKGLHEEEENKILTNVIFKTPSKSDSQNTASSSTEEKSPQVGFGKGKKRVKRGLKKCKTDVLSQMVISNDNYNYSEKDRRSENDHTMRSENIYRNCEIDNKSNDPAPIDSNIQRNEKILDIVEIPKEVKCPISSNEGLLLKEEKTKNLSSDKNSSKVEHTIHSNFRNSNLEKSCLLPSIQEICPATSVTSLSAASEKENVEVLTASSIVKNAALEKGETVIISSPKKNDTNCYESVCHEAIQDKNSNNSVSVPENKSSSNVMNNNNPLNITFNHHMFTPKGLFTSHLHSDDVSSTSNNIKENASTAKELDILKLSSSLPPSTTLTKTHVSLNKNLEEQCSVDLSKCMNNHNGFLSDVNEATHDEKTNETISDCLPTPVHNDYPDGQINRTDKFLTTVASVTEENAFEAPLDVSHNDEVIDSKINTNKNMDSIESEVMDFDDFNSDHSLVIAENEDNLHSSMVTSDNDMTSESSSKCNADKVNPKRKQKKSKKQKNKSDRTMSQILNLNKQPSSSKSKKETSVMHVSFASAFQALDQIKFTDAHFKLAQHTLMNVLMNPRNAVNARMAVHKILKYLSFSKSNPFLNYHLRGDTTSLFPLAEKCLVSALLLVSKKKKQHLQGLVDSTINTIYEFVLTKDKLSIHGLSSMCRVMTELCKNKDYQEKTLLLCCDLLKIHHKYAPYLIASIASVWKEIFDIRLASVKEKIFLSSIAYGVLKKPTTLTEQQWIHCSKILSLCISAPPFSNVKETIKSLMDMIIVTFKTGVLEDENIFITPVVTIAACEGWEWAKENIIDEYVIPFMVKFSEQERNEKAFKLFCNMYVDICNFCPNIEEPNEVLSDFFETGNLGESFVTTIVAMAQLKFLLLRKLQLLPPHLTEWVNENKKNPEIYTFAHNLFQKRLMMDETDLLESEVQ